jgi:hypothetical protein
MLKFGGVTNQVQFARPDIIPQDNNKIDPRIQGRIQTKVVDIGADWTTKKISPVRFQDTHSRIFEK